ncbi:hypothetical protein DFP72DRAFT_1042194 [Ephemerocybe angulata]|uniref:Uncharacterized protein n=1 Tax=Ephemerocybe angulata TaxID=980116 RepID=A0A8H6I9C9_9AGAR|nr:hypothetical protein DFP72DRAFT_1042194 [Tulosesus angulatus]
MARSAGSGASVERSTQWLAGSTAQIGCKLTTEAPSFQCMAKTCRYPIPANRTFVSPVEAASRANGFMEEKMERLPKSGGHRLGDVQPLTGRLKPDTSDGYAPEAWVPAMVRLEGASKCELNPMEQEGEGRGRQQFDNRTWRHRPQQTVDRAPQYHAAASGTMGCVPSTSMSSDRVFQNSRTTIDLRQIVAMSNARHSNGEEPIVSRTPIGCSPWYTEGRTKRDSKRASWQKKQAVRQTTAETGSSEPEPVQALNTFSLFLPGKPLAAVRSIIGRNLCIRIQRRRLEQASQNDTEGVNSQAQLSNHHQRTERSPAMSYAARKMGKGLFDRAKVPEWRRDLQIRGAPVGSAGWKKGVKADD